MTDYTTRDMRYILNKIHRLSTVEHAGIFNILSRHNIPYTHNNNGIFVNLSVVPKHVVKEIDVFVETSFMNYKKEQQEKAQVEIKNKEEKEKDTMENVECKDGEEERDQDNVTDWTHMLPYKDIQNTADNLLHHFEDNIENINKKRASMKFTNAKRKFARKPNVENKKLDSDLCNTLKQENFIL